MKEEIAMSKELQKCLESIGEYKPRHIVFAKKHTNGISLGYRTEGNCAGLGTTYFDIQIIEDKCYILWIERNKKDHGKGIGKKIVNAIEDFSKKYNCKSVIVKPSGPGRDQYWKSLGYTNKLETGELEKLI